MNTASEDMKDVLEAEAILGLVFKTNLYLFREPAEPDDVVTLFEVGGDPSTLLLSTPENAYQKPSIQIRLRWRDPKEAFELAYKIEKLLHGSPQREINGAFYTMIKSLHPPYLLDWDESNRVRIALNFDIQRREV